MPKLAGGRSVGECQSLWCQRAAWTHGDATACGAKGGIEAKTGNRSTEMPQPACKATGLGKTMRARRCGQGNQGGQGGACKATGAGKEV